MNDEQKRSVIRQNLEYARVWPDIAATMTEEIARIKANTPRPRTFPGQNRTICKHFGDDTGTTVACGKCPGSLVLKVFQCGVYGSCTIGKEVDGLGCCKGCIAYEALTDADSHLPKPVVFAPGEVPVLSERVSRAGVPIKVPVRQAVVHKPKPRSNTLINTSPNQMPGVHHAHGRSLRWEYGITTVPDRIDVLLPRTLASLRAGGFDKPRLFIDGVHHVLVEDSYGKFSLPITPRWNKVGCHANWFLSMHELFLRNPNADRYAMFQDDLVCVKNLRQYLEAIPYEEYKPDPRKPDHRGQYWNLYTFRENHSIGIANGHKPTGFHEGSILDSATGGKYHGKRQQAGRSALALVFSREAMVEVLCSRHMVKRCMDPMRGGIGILVDGGIVEGMNQANFWEQVHNPSLVQHTGDKSTIGHDGQQKAETFPGESFDALTLLQAPATTHA